MSAISLKQATENATHNSAIEYHPVYTTARGISKICFGSLKCLVGVGASCSKTYQEDSKSLIDGGWRVLKQGMKDAAPAAAITAVTGTIVVVVGLKAIATLVLVSATVVATNYIVNP